jgi:Flp pilus assembly pilin Flp
MIYIVFTNQREASSMNGIKALLRDQHGATAVQYAMIAGVLSVAVLAGSLALRGELIDLYQGMSVQANEALGGNPGG